MDVTLTDDEMKSIEGLDQGPKARGFTMVDLFKGWVLHSSIILAMKSNATTYISSFLSNYLTTA